MNKEQKEKANQLTKEKKVLFWGILVSIPVIFFVLLEVILSAVNYGGNLSLFIDGPDGYEQYFRLNPDVGKRYFYNEATVPTLPNQLMLKEKPENLYRIFVFGGSSAAGFPYSNNTAFPNQLNSMLSEAYKGKRFEVINIAMSAVNSYTWQDLTDEVLEQQPDLILLYGGHNEYYGALGVGSVQTLGNSRWITRTYLSLKNYCTLRMMRDIIGWIKITVLSNASGNAEKSAETLMSRIVAEQNIFCNDQIYTAGKEQFRENLQIFIDKFTSNHIPVIPATLVSNLKDQKPFVSQEFEETAPAAEYYNSAILAFESGDYNEANNSFKKAKDADGLRFRAPSEFNDIINATSAEYKLDVADVEKYYENTSPNGIIGNNLLLEHLHPNIKGYSLIAKAFFDVIKEGGYPGIGHSPYDSDFVQSAAITELDSVYGAVVIKRLKSGWPFKSKDVKNTFLSTFRPANKLEELAIKVIKKENYNLESAHKELGQYYEKQKWYDKAFREYSALIASIPHIPEFYEEAARVSLLAKNYDKAQYVLEKSLYYKTTWYALKWIGQIALMEKDYKKAVKYLKAADQRDEQVCFNLIRSYLGDGDLKSALTYYKTFKTNFPRSKYIKALHKYLRPDLKNLKKG